MNTRKRFPRTRFVRQHSRRKHWLPRGVDLLGECREELALIAERRRDESV